MDCQLDFPISAKTILLYALISIVKAPLANKSITKKLLNFYVKNSTPQYESWSLKRIVALKVGKPIGVDGFANVNLKAFRSHNIEVHELSLADIPFMNSYDWISLFNNISKDTMKYEPIFQFLIRMIWAYILEIAKMDVEVAAVHNQKPILKPFPVPDNVEKFKYGFIEK